jgi:iron(II)-dependent oxidoreductase
MHNAHLRAALQAALTETRCGTLALMDLVPEGLFQHPIDPDYSPLGWHFGHIGMTEGYWVLEQAKGDAPLRPDYLYLFSTTARPREERSRIPGRETVRRYLAEVRAAVETYLARVDLGAPNPLLREGFIFYSVLQHEWQHQETIVELLRLADCLTVEPAALPLTKEGWLPLPGARYPARQEQNASPPRRAPGTGHRAPFPLPFAALLENTLTQVRIPAGPFPMGLDDVIAYDNEKPVHEREVPEFEIDAFPVTNREYIRFIAEGGYTHREWWSEEGWAWREANKIEAPLSWQRDGQDGWRSREIGGARPVPADHPVSCVSWFEAEAFARSVGRRLPTEAEWEKAASWDAAGGQKRRFPWGEEPPGPARAQFDLHGWSTAPVTAHPAGRSAAGCWDMAGNVWEWTASPFTGYPGFRAFPYDGYSAVYLDGPYKVLKGGSWASRGPILRCSFRNWYVPSYRQGLLGFRCCRGE